jgi:uncharacterized protein (DUF934 family)
MPLLEAGHPVADRYAGVADDAPLPDGPALISLARLQVEPLSGRNMELGVVVPSTTPAAELAPLLDRVSLVAIEFPKFRDGRGFTIARTLRERHGYAGEIRAIGHLLPDQHSHALRCGFTTVTVADDADLGPWQAALTWFHTSYQPDATGSEVVVSGLRRRRSFGGASQAG